MNERAFVDNYSQPFGTGRLYGPPPYSYLGARDSVITYEAESRDDVAEFLPPGMEVADEYPICSYVARCFPFSSAGPYHESFVLVRVRFENRIYRYQPAIYCDSDLAMAAGREIYGYPKKLARFECSCATSVQRNEAWTQSVFRPSAKLLASSSIVLDRRMDPTSLERVPTLSLKVIPGVEDPSTPQIAQLVKLELKSNVQVNQAGQPSMWAGRGALDMIGLSDFDPLSKFRPRRILSSYFVISDFELPLGTIFHDYLA